MKNSTTQEYITPFQYKIPLEISQIIEITDPVYTFSEVMAHIDLRKNFAEEGCKMGRPRCDAEKLLKVILFAFMEEGYPEDSQSIKSLKDAMSYVHGQLLVLFERMKSEDLYSYFLESINSLSNPGE